MEDTTDQDQNQDKSLDLNENQNLYTNDYDFYEEFPKSADAFRYHEPSVVDRIVKWLLRVLGWDNGKDYSDDDDDTYDHSVLHDKPLYQMGVEDYDKDGDLVGGGGVNVLNQSRSNADVNVTIDDVEEYLQKAYEVKEKEPPFLFREDLIGVHKSVPDVLVRDKKALALEFLSRNRVVFGIPSIYRDEMYLFRMVQEMLVKCGDDKIRRHLKIVILNGHYPPEDHLWMPKFRKYFREFINNGTIEILELQGRYHRLEDQGLEERYKDSVERTMWRSKQVLDFAYLMEYCSTISDYYVQLEDDVVPTKDYLIHMAHFVQKYYERKSWYMLSFYSADVIDCFKEYPSTSFFGFIGQMYKSNTLPHLVRYFREKYYVSPVDWLMADYLRALEKSHLSDGNVQYQVFSHFPSLFQHIGKSSSLKGKVQDFKVKYFLEDLDILVDKPAEDNEIFTYDQKKRVALEFLRNNRIVFAMPSVKRSVDYLRATIIKMLRKVDPELLPYMKILILNADLSDQYDEIHNLDSTLRYYFDTGTLELLELDGPYEKMKGNLRNLFKDENDRLEWRSKQSLDFAFLMKYAHEELDDFAFYVQMEDDLEFSDHYLTEMAWWISKYFENRNDWFQLSFYSSYQYPDRYRYPEKDFFGFIGQLFRTKDLKPLYQFIEERFDLAPVDWLQRDYLIENKVKIFSHYPSIFQHVGKTSSLEGKTQNLKAEAFVKDATSKCRFVKHKLSCLDSADNSAFLNSHLLELKNEELIADRSLDEKILQKNITKLAYKLITESHLVVGLSISSFDQTNITKTLRSLSLITKQEAKFTHIIIVDNLIHDVLIRKLDDLVSSVFYSRAKSHLIHRYSIKERENAHVIGFLASSSLQYGKYFFYLEPGATWRRLTPTFIARVLFIEERNTKSHHVYCFSCPKDGNEKLQSLNGLMFHSQQLTDIIPLLADGFDSPLSIVNAYLDSKKFIPESFATPLVRVYQSEELSTETTEENEL